jgi:hypothetical protein
MYPKKMSRQLQKENYIITNHIHGLGSFDKRELECNGMDKHLFSNITK